MSVLSLQPRHYKTLLFTALAFALPAAVRADIVSSATMSAGSSYNLDTGQAGAGDITFTGTSMTFIGSASGVSLGPGGSGTYNTLTQQILAVAGVSFTQAPIPSSSLTTDSVIGVKTNGGHYAKLWITASSASSITFSYTTYGATQGSGGGGGPTITSILNNYSFLPAGLPNSGIAQGSIFVIIGSGLGSDDTAVLQNVTAAGGLPQTWHQTSLSVTVNNTTTTPYLYYTSKTAVAGVMPTGTPTGTGTLKLTFNGQSATAPVTVVTSALGLDTLYGIGTGIGTVTDANFKVILFNNPAKPKQAVILWGSGIGPDPNNDDHTYPQNLNNLTNIQTTAWVGDQQANISYRGRSQFPGLDQIVITIPDGVSGCFVPIVLQQGNIVSNTITTAISADGSPCSDPAFGLDASLLTSLAGEGTVRSGSLFVDHSIDGAMTIDGVGASFQKYPAGQYGSGNGLVSVGSCTIIPPSSDTIFPSTGLDAGTIVATASTGQVTLTKNPVSAGSYFGQLPAGAITAAGGTVSFNNGGGGADVGGFSTSVNMQNLFTWTNQPSLGTITRSQGATLTWTGGFPNSRMEIFGSSTSGQITVSFICEAPASALQFTIPVPVLLALPASTSGSLSLTNQTVPQPFSASGLDFGQAFGFAGVFNSDVVYQ